MAIPETFFHPERDTGSAEHYVMTFYMIVDNAAAAKPYNGRKCHNIFYVIER